MVRQAILIFISLIAICPSFGATLEERKAADEMIRAFENSSPLEFIGDLYGGANGRSQFSRYFSRIKDQIKERIIEHRSKKENNFSDLLISAGKQRNWLAKKAGDIEFEPFGRRRTLESVRKDVIVDHGPIDSSDLGIGFLRQFKTVASSSKNPEWFFPIKLEMFLFLNQAKNSNILRTRWRESSLSRYRISIIAPSAQGINPVNLAKVGTEEEMVEFEDRHLLFDYFINRPYDYPSAKELISGRKLGGVKLELQIKIKDTFVPTTTQYALFGWDPASHNGVSQASIALFVQLPLLLARHTWTNYAERIFQDIELLWGKVLCWEKEKSTVDDLKLLVGELQFKYSHAMPFYRGSAAIGEWIFKALFESHGFRAHFFKWDSADSKAFGAVEMGAFLKEYSEDLVLSED